MANSTPIYLDYNATAPMRPEVISTMVDVMKEGGNPSSVHSVGRRAKSNMELARSIISTTIKCRSQMIVFTSGGTESNNMAILSCNKGRLITTNVEHDSVRSACSRFQGKVDILNVNSDGLIDLDELRKFLEKDSENTIVSVLYANNETGVIQNIKKITEIVHNSGALLHIDAIQALGKIDINFMELGADMMSLSAHKIGGPQGVGALIAREKIAVMSAILGGGQELGRRGGTENIAGIAGFGKAVSLIPELLLKMKELEKWRNHIERRIGEHSSKAIFLGKNAKRLPNVSTIYMPDVLSETQVMNFDLDNICISSGSACSSGKVKASHVVKAMSGDDRIAGSTIRMSLGWNSTDTDTEAFIASWIKQYDRKHK